MATEDVMLTTIDNPWNPFTHWNEWREYDEAAGHFTLALVGRIAVSSDELSETDQDRAVLDAFNEIIQENVSGVHVKVTRDSERFTKI